MKCPFQMDESSPTLWDCPPKEGKENLTWATEPSGAGGVTSLIQSLSLSDSCATPSVPPSKRQCRSLSFSDERSACRASWRPHGSRVWTPVEKRRCYSGGSVQHYSCDSSHMQRSSSFSLPSSSATTSPSYEPSGFDQQSLRMSGSYGQAGAIWGQDAVVGDMHRSFSCSRELVSSEYGPPSMSSTPASTPEMLRRSGGGLARSRSQPCVLNEKKAAVKRRHPEKTQAQEPRPSLDLAKMTQDLPTFHTLSSLHSTANECSPESPFLHSASSSTGWRAPSWDLYAMPGATPASSPVPETFPSTVEHHALVPRTNPEATSTPAPALKHSLRSTPALDYPRQYRENPVHLPHQTPGQSLASASGIHTTDWPLDWEDQEAQSLGADQGSGRSGRALPGATSGCIFPIDGELDIEQIENN
ncbi:protein FAM53B [Ambystoma mexicanum]|uniref:protein FAM53B n=1 Tax=Ambystoma mexicanum TaxID=8296 RepID=UPI0037E83172